MDRPTRPALRYFGGKWRLAPWIIEHFAPHEVYVEPFAGGGGVLLRKPRSALEVYNDLDEEAVTFFRVLRNRPDDLIDQIQNTPFARAEWEQSYEPADDPVEQARRFYVRSWQAYGSTGLRKNNTGWRAEKTTARGKRLLDDWNEMEHLYAVAERFGEVQIDCRPASECIDFYDGPDTLFYCDPPYLAETRDRSRGYSEEMHTREAHESLADQLVSIEGMAAVSGYSSDLYAVWYGRNGWKEVSTTNRTMAGGTHQTECLWLSPSLQERRRQDLFFDEAEQK